MTLIDPEGLRPEWGRELWRICKREGWCGKFRRIGVHAVDGWTGPNAYLWAVHRGQLDPVQCEEHRLSDYGPVLAALDRWEARYGRRRAEARAKIEGLEHGEWTARDFATRGGFGQNAARHLHYLGECVAPSALDDPANAALAAAHTLQECRVWDDNPERPGRRMQRECTCDEHVSQWVGGGIWNQRPLFSLFGKSRFSSVQTQCGPKEAVRYTVGSLLSLAFRVITADVGA